jgi:hypothetical protein
MSGFAPSCAAPSAALWPASTAGVASGAVRVSDLPSREAVWAVEITAPGPSGQARPAPFGMISGMPSLTLSLPPDPLAPGDGAIVVTDRDWIGEPDDPDAPNVRWPSRLLEPPVLELGMPIYPTEGRRTEITAGELLLANADGALDGLRGAWRLAGRKVVISRGPLRRPVHARRAEFGRVAEMRVRRAPDGAGRLRLTLTSGAADLSVPANNLYAGTGGVEGPQSLTGQAKPRLYGIRRAMAPVLVDAGRLIYQVSDGGLQEVLSVSNQGVPWTPLGDLGGYGALEAATVPATSYYTCLASGHIRLGSTSSALSVAARGDPLAGSGTYRGGTAASIAIALLTGPGGVAVDQAPDWAFSSWPGGECGLLVAGGTVADAMERLAAGVGASWGADAFGRWYGRALVAPEAQGPSLALEPWMLRAPPEPAVQDQPPWWRARVTYQGRDVVLSGQDIAPSVAAAERDLLGQASLMAPPVLGAAQNLYPMALDGSVLDSVFDQVGPAEALAGSLMALFGVPREAWRVQIGAGAAGVAPQMLMPGTVVSLTWPGILSLAQPKPMLVRDVSSVGDRMTLTLWG